VIHLYLQKHFASAGVVGTISYLVASTFRPDLRPILYGASFFAFAPLPYTFTVCEYRFTRYHVSVELTNHPKTVRPTNNNIFKISEDASKHGGKGPDPGRVDELLGEWTRYHSIRMSFGAVAWTLGMAVLLLA